MYIVYLYTYLDKHVGSDWSSCSSWRRYQGYYGEGYKPGIFKGYPGSWIEKGGGEGSCYKTWIIYLKVILGPGLRRGEEKVLVIKPGLYI